MVTISSSSEIKQQPYFVGEQPSEDQVIKIIDALTILSQPTALSQVLHQVETQYLETQDKLIG